jgi:GNAT superfamily N-acetyltransferase
MTTESKAMIELKFRPVATELDLKAAFNILQQLRENLTEEEFFSLYRMARSESGYRLAGAYSGELLVAVMGIRTLTDFVHGRHIYIDDLVVDSNSRSNGIGAQFLKWAEKEAQLEKCGLVRLCTGVERKDAHRFYSANHYEYKSAAFKKNIPF